MVWRRSTSSTRASLAGLVVLHGTKIEDIPLAEAIAKNRTVDDSFLSIISSLEPKL